MNGHALLCEPWFKNYLERLLPRDSRQPSQLTIFLSLDHISLTSSAEMKTDQSNGKAEVSFSLELWDFVKFCSVSQADRHFGLAGSYRQSTS